MNQKKINNNNINLYIFPINFLVSLVLLHVLKKPINFVVFIICILLLSYMEIGIISYIFKKEIGFFFVFLKYSKTCIGTKYWRFVTFIMYIAVSIIIVLFFLFNKTLIKFDSIISHVFFYKTIKKVDSILKINSISANDKFRGIVYLAFFIGLVASILFWLSHLITQILHWKKRSKGQG